MKFLSFGRIVAIAAFLVAFAAASLNAQTRIYSNVYPQEAGSYLGVYLDDLTADNLSRYKLDSERGAIVRSVVKNSPAEAAKLQEDDVILEFAGIQVWSAAQLSRLVEETPAGRKVDLAIHRDGKRMNLTAQIKKRAGMESEERSQALPSLRYFRDLERFFTPDGQRSFQTIVPDRPGDRKPKLGITLQPLTEQQAEYFAVPGKKGVLVSSVAANSASSGKLSANDVIVSADGKLVEDPDDLVRIVQNKTGGDVSLKVIRNKKELSVVVSVPEESKESKGYKL